MAKIPTPKPAAEATTELVIITPTIGRRVWYWPTQAELEARSNPPVAQISPEQPFDAGVVFVHDDRLVNLVVTDHAGNVHKREAVQLVQDGDCYATDDARCEWMPYQKAKAA